jgi:hypothetical protein
MYVWLYVYTYVFMYVHKYYLTRVKYALVKYARTRIAYISSSVYVSSYYECISALVGYHELRVKYEDT